MTVEIHRHDPQSEKLTFTEAAKKHLLACLGKKTAATGVRLSLAKTGCSGLSYVLDYVEKPQEDDLVFPLDGDYLFFVDKAAYPIIKGLRIDFIQQGLNQKLVFSNPNQTGQCGCGESFTIDE